MLQPCQTFLARSFRAVAAVKRRPIFHAPTSGSLARFFGRNSTPREIRRLQLPSPTHTRIVEETRLSIRAKLLPPLPSSTIIVTKIKFRWIRKILTHSSLVHLIPSRVLITFQSRKGELEGREKGVKSIEWSESGRRLSATFTGFFFIYIDIVERRMGV